MTPIRRCTWVAVAALATMGLGAHALDSYRRRAVTDDLLFHDGWREVSGAVGSQLGLANLALLLAAVGALLALRAEQPGHRMVETAMKAIVVAGVVAFPPVLPGAAWALFRRLSQKAPTPPGRRALRGAAMVSIAGLLLGAAGLQAQRHTTWVRSAFDGWPSWCVEYWLGWPDQLKLPVLAAARSWYIPVCLVASVALAVLLRRSYDDPTLLERRLMAVAVPAALVYWAPAIPFVLFSGLLVDTMVVLAIVAVIGRAAAEIIVGGPAATPSP